MFQKRYQVLVPSQGTKSLPLFQFARFGAKKGSVGVKTGRGGIFWVVWVGIYGQNHFEMHFCQKEKNTCFMTPYTWGLIPPRHTVQASRF